MNHNLAKLLVTCKKSFFPEVWKEEGERVTKVYKNNPHLTFGLEQSIEQLTLTHPRVLSDFFTGDTAQLFNLHQPYKAGFVVPQANAC